MPINIYCQTSLQPHEQVQCSDYNPGGITQMIVFSPDNTVTDFTDAAQIQAAIDTNQAWQFRDIQADIPAPSPKTINNPVTNVPSTTGYDRTVNVFDWNTTANNVDLYDLLNRYTTTDVLLYEILNDGVGRVTHINEDQFGIQFDINRTVPLDNATFQQFEGTLAWSKFDQPAIIDAAPGIFV